MPDKKPARKELEERVALLSEACLALENQALKIQRARVDAEELVKIMTGRCEELQVDNDKAWDALDRMTEAHANVALELAEERKLHRITINDLLYSQHAQTVATEMYDKASTLYTELASLCKQLGTKAKHKGNIFSREFIRVDMDLALWNAIVRSSSKVSG